MRRAPTTMVARGEELGAWGRGVWLRWSVDDSTEARRFANMGDVEDMGDRVNVARRRTTWTKTDGEQHRHLVHHYSREEIF